MDGHKDGNNDGITGSANQPTRLFFVSSLCLSHRLGLIPVAELQIQSSIENLAELPINRLESQGKRIP